MADLRSAIVSEVIDVVTGEQFQGRYRYSLKLEQWQNSHRLLLLSMDIQSLKK